MSPKRPPEMPPALASDNQKATLIGIAALIVFMSWQVREVRGLRADLSARDEACCQGCGNDHPELPVGEPVPPNGVPAPVKPLLVVSDRLPWPGGIDFDIQPIPALEPGKPSFLGSAHDSL